ncbi:hypothetical protein QQ045_026813 [Rhodiola kirilowii]
MDGCGAGSDMAGGAVGGLRRGLGGTSRLRQSPSAGFLGPAGTGFDLIGRIWSGSSLAVVFCLVVRRVPPGLVVFSILFGGVFHPYWPHPPNTANLHPRTSAPILAPKPATIPSRAVTVTETSEVQPERPTRGDKDSAGQDGGSEGEGLAVGGGKATGNKARWIRLCMGGKGTANERRATVKVASRFFARLLGSTSL